MRWLPQRHPDTTMVVDAGKLTIPTMLREDMVRAVQSGHMGPSLAMLVYTEQSYEVISGPWGQFIDEAGYRSYWVGDRVVAVDDDEGVPMPVPSLVHLQVGTTLSVVRLMREQIRAA